VPCFIYNSEEKFILNLDSPCNFAIFFSCPSLLCCLLPFLYFGDVKVAYPAFSSHGVNEEVILPVIDQHSCVLDAISSIICKAHSYISHKLIVHIIVTAFVCVVFRNPIEGLCCVFIQIFNIKRY